MKHTFILSCKKINQKCSTALTNPIYDLAMKGALEGNNTNQTAPTFSRTLTFTPDYNH